MTRAGQVAAVGVFVFTAGSHAHLQTPTPTRVVRFVPPTTLPDRAELANCHPSAAAADRDDALACTTGAKEYDPCFVTKRAGILLCDVDPRDASKGLLVSSPAPPPPSATHAAGHRAWFFELTDGTTCRPSDGTAREVDGLAEIYTCKFSVPGQADAVLGELDSSTPVWTIQQVLLNKKVEPPTIKSLLTATVKTVWQ